MKRQLRILVAAAVPIVLGACMAGTTPGPVASPPFSSAPPAASPSVPATTPVRSLAPGVFFRDDFDGDSLDPTLWRAFARDGLVVVKDGALQMVAGGLTATFPVVVPVADNIPKVGPYYVELVYQMISVGRRSGFNIDFLAPSSAEDPGLSAPFLTWATYRQELMFAMKTETRSYGPVAFGGSLSTAKPHRFRLEFDGEGSYRVIFDDTELMVVPSHRRPSYLWFGPSPNEPVKPTSWASWKVDYVESGVLVTPDPAKPRATPTPRPSASAAASPGPSPAASGDASASPEPSTSPEPSASPEPSPAADG